jgi:hypothetical protein
MPARAARLQPSTGERPQESDDGEEKNGMASLVVYCWRNNWGCISFRSRAPLSGRLRRARRRRRGRGDGAVVRRMDARRSKGENHTFQHVMDGRNGERLHFLATAQACFREATGDPKNARQAGMTSAASNFLPNLTAACAAPGRHSCDAAIVRSFTLSMHSFTLSCCGQRLSPWTMPHDPEIFRNEWLQKTTAPRCRTDSIGEDTESGIDESLRKLAKRKAPWTHTTPTS